MKIKYLHIIVLLLFGIILNSCAKKNELIQQEIMLEYFDQITFERYFEVVLIQGDEQKIIVESNRKQAQKLNYTIIDSVLTIDSKARNTWINPDKNKVKLTIYFKNLKKLNVDESCEISSLGTISGEELGIIFASKLNEASLDLNYNTIYYWNNFPCGGKLNLTGNCQELKIWNYALMSVNAENLISKNAFINNSSKGDCTLNVSDFLEYEIHGEGNIRIIGVPSFIKKIEEKGLGKLIYL
jgi:hypothetical protein